MTIRIETVIECGQGQLPPLAYLGIAVGSLDQDGRTVLTAREASFAALQAQVDEIKAQLDACLAEAKACLPG
jgi:hypothetical protein